MQKSGLEITHPWHFFSPSQSSCCEALHILSIVPVVPSRVDRRRRPFSQENCERGWRVCGGEGLPDIAEAGAVGGREPKVLFGRNFSSRQVRLWKPTQTITPTPSLPGLNTLQRLPDHFGTPLKTLSLFSPLPSSTNLQSFQIKSSFQSVASKASWPLTLIPATHWLTEPLPFPCHLEVSHLKPLPLSLSCIPQLSQPQTGQPLWIPRRSFQGDDLGSDPCWVTLAKSVPL